MARFDLAPGMAEFIADYLAATAPSTTDTIEGQRRDYELLVRRFRYPHPRGIATDDFEVDGRHGPVPLRRYRYRDGNDSALVLFLHGGGFILGSLDSHDDICAEICASSGFDLVSVGYRLAPEYRHPVQLDDVEDAFAALGHRKTILFGVSAGGCLAAALCHRRRAAALRPAGQVLVYPGLGGDALGLDAYRDNADAPLLGTADIAFYRGLRWGGDDLPTDDPEFYPLAAQDFGGVAPTVAQSADIDPLRDDARAYVARLTAAGVAAEWINEPGLTHDYLRARHVCATAAAAFARVVAAIGRLAASA